MGRKVCVVGLGYIGLPTAAVLVSAGHEVVGVDVNPSVVKLINQGKIHIVEPELEKYVSEAVANQRLRAQLEAEPAEIFMICVPTPFYRDRGVPTPNLDYVVAAAKAIAPHVRAGNLVILESTCPVGTTEMLAKALSEAGVNTDQVHIAYCPERVLPGQIMRELVENDRIVGGLTPEAGSLIADFYKTFVSKGQVFVTNAPTAELSKLVENSYRDVNIAFANELSMICHKAGINPNDLISLANRHPRVNILNPGPGVGGHCIAVDPWFIVSMDPENSQIIRKAREINNHKAEWAKVRIRDAADMFESIHGRPAKIAALGLAFKPNIDDVRESPALKITGELIASGYDVLAVEPNVKEHKNLKLTELSTALEQADIFVFLVAHNEFKTLEITNRVVLDLCGIQGYRWDSISK